MAYPASLDSFTANTDGVDEVIAADVNVLQAAIVAIETELGTDPAGSATDLKTRLAIALTDAGYTKNAPGTTLTISSGVITITGNYHKLETQSSAASDDLDTINGGAAGGFVRLVTVNDSRDVVIKHGTGNIYCAGDKDITLSTSYQFCDLQYDSTNTRWIASKSQPIVAASALTTQLTSITHTAPGTADYAVQDLVDSACFGFVTKDEGNTVLKVILNLQVRVAELEDKLQALGLLA